MRILAARISGTQTTDKETTQLRDTTGRNGLGKTRKYTPQLSWKQTYTKRQ